MKRYEAINKFNHYMKQKTAQIRKSELYKVFIIRTERKKIDHKLNNLKKCFYNILCDIMIYNV